MERDQREAVGSPPDPEDDYLVEFDFDEGWFDLTLLLGMRVEARRKVAEIVEQFGPLRPGVSKTSLQ